MPSSDHEDTGTFQLHFPFFQDSHRFVLKARRHWQVRKLPSERSNVTYMGQNHQWEVRKYLTGIIKNRELHGTFEVLLQNRAQALVQPGLSIVDREDHRLEFKEVG